METRDKMHRRRFADPHDRRERAPHRAEGRHGGGPDGPGGPEPRGEHHRGGPTDRPGREPRERGARGEHHRRGHEERPWRGRGGPRVGRGDVRAAALALLAGQPMHGYEIIQQITSRSGGVWRPSAGSVYPALQLLEDQGLVGSEQADGRRVFHLTEAGRAYVEEHRDELATPWDAVTESVDEAVLELRDLFEQVGAALRQVAQVATPPQIGEARELLISVRRQLYRILAGDDPNADRS